MNGFTLVKFSSILFKGEKANNKKSNKHNKVHIKEKKFNIFPKVSTSPFFIIFILVNHGRLYHTIHVRINFILNRNLGGI